MASLRDNVLAYFDGHGTWIEHIIDKFSNEGTTLLDALLDQRWMFSSPYNSHVDCQVLYVLIVFSFPV